MTLSISEDCSPRLLLCSSVTQAYRNRHRQTSLFNASLLVTDQMRSSVIDLPGPTSTDIAFLQYTSGSTGCPKGVKVTHANLIANQHSIANAFEHTNASIFVSWLPTFHDMGLVGATLQPLFVGFPAIHIAPEVFVRDPLKWLALISNEKATTSGAPNFAYDYCVDRIPDRALDALDLSTWKVAFNGAEPVRAATMDRFMAKFRRCGFEPTSFLPCYGMAESTLFVSGGPAGTWSQKRSPNENRDMPGTDVCQALNRDSTKVVSCGVIATNTSIKIIHASGAELQEGSVGDIWISGPSVCDGYWDVELATCRTFNQTLEEDTGGRWLRMGDLGFIQDNELFVTGRVKDLIVIRGRNIHAEDIERLARDTFDLQALQGVVAFEHPDFDRPGIVVAVESLTVQIQLADQMFEDLSQAIAESHGASLRSLLSRLRRRSFEDIVHPSCVGLFAARQSEDTRGNRSPRPQCTVRTYRSACDGVPPRRATGCIR